MSSHNPSSYNVLLIDAYPSKFLRPPIVTDLDHLRAQMYQPVLINIIRNVITCHSPEYRIYGGLLLGTYWIIPQIR